MSGVEQTVYHALLIGGFVAAPIAFAVLLRIPAPYGRHARGGWGPQIPRRLGWMVMELPAVAALPVCMFIARPEMTAPLWMFLTLWEIHYVNRSLIFPLRLRDRGKSNPVIVVLLAIGFNLFNGYLNGRYLGAHAQDYGTAWFSDPRFAIGMAVFLAGLATNWWADQRLLRLRRGGGDREYTIPRGGLFRWVSCPNYLGEIVEWCGWAILVWSWPGLLFAVWTAANLVPRARAHHAWYRERFPDYPRERRAVIPFLY